MGDVVDFPLQRRRQQLESGRREAALDRIRKAMDNMVAAASGIRQASAELALAGRKLEAEAARMEASRDRLGEVCRKLKQRQQESLAIAAQAEATEQEILRLIAERAAT